MSFCQIQAFPYTTTLSKDRIHPLLFIQLLLLPFSNSFLLFVYSALTQAAFFNSKSFSYISTFSNLEYSNLSAISHHLNKFPSVHTLSFLTRQEKVNSHSVFAAPLLLFHRSTTSRISSDQGERKERSFSQNI